MHSEVILFIATIIIIIIMINNADYIYRSASLLNKFSARDHMMTTFWHLWAFPALHWFILPH